MNMRRIDFFMDNDTKVTLTVSERVYQEFENLLPLGEPVSVWAAGQRGSGRLGEEVTIGVNWAHVLSWQAVKV